MTHENIKYEQSLSALHKSITYHFLKMGYLYSDGLV